MREDGYYWVTITSENKDFRTGRNVVAEFDGWGWKIPGMLFVFDADEVSVLSDRLPEPTPPPAPAAAAPQ